MHNPDQERKAQEQYGRQLQRGKQRYDNPRRISKENPNPPKFHGQAKKPDQPKIPGHEALLYKAYNEKLTVEILEEREEETYFAQIIGYDAYTLLLKRLDKTDGIVVVFKHAISNFKVLPAKEKSVE